MKRWDILNKFDPPAGEAGIRNSKFEIEDAIKILLANRGLTDKKEVIAFLSPPDPNDLSAKDVGIEPQSLKDAIARIQKAIKNKESIVVYADYDADGITAGAIMWETLHRLGATVMPYIPHRVEEGYGLSLKGLDTVRQQYDPTLIITVDHGITAKDKIAYAKKLGIDVVVTDHHTKPEKLPACTIIHTTKLSGSGLSWFLSKELLEKFDKKNKQVDDELLVLTTIGTIADLVPLVGPNRSIVSFGLKALNKTTRVGIESLMKDARLEKGNVGTYEVSHVLAPRLNAMGRLEHALDALRMLCTNQPAKADLLASKLGLTNKERQKLTIDTTLHAVDGLKNSKKMEKLLFVSDVTYNQGVIGLVAGKLVEQYYRPAVVVAIGEEFSKASARSISGFNIVEAIRECSDILIDVGGHPMAAGFTVETKNLVKLKTRLEKLAEKIPEELMTRSLKIDMEVPLDIVSQKFWKELQVFEPFGFGNIEPIFTSAGVIINDVRQIGADGKHLKLRLSISGSNQYLDAVAFGMGTMYKELKSDRPVDLAYAIEMNTWNGSSKLQLKIKDIHLQ
jgi:single-stranded-DNA-specific exonuclease